MPNERIGRMYYLRGKLLLESPLLIGCGAQGNVDLPVLKDAKGIPYIPGTSLGGVLRHYFRERLGADFNLEQIESFWGSEKASESRLQSSLFVYDLHPMDNGNVNVVVRDGVALNELGVAQDKKKYDYEIVEPGAAFDFRAEIVLREAFDQNVFLRIIAFIMSSLENGEIALGAMTTKGFGRCRLEEGECRVFDFSKERDALSWLARDIQNGQKVDLKSFVASKKTSGDFAAKISLSLKSSLIVRSYSSRPEDPDAVHINSGGHPVLPGTSIKGAIRARAERIMKTLGGNQNDLKNLFGWVSEDGKAATDKCRSRFIVEESLMFESEISKEQQTRIKIDRFTGGVIDGALFNSMPVWSKDTETPTLTISLRVHKCEEWEAGLMMLIIKDLWNGDLPIGGEKAIGRGVFSGVSVDIDFKGDSYKIARKDSALHIQGQKTDMEKWVTAFGDRCKGEALSCMA